MNQIHSQIHIWYCLYVDMRHILTLILIMMPLPSLQSCCFLPPVIVPDCDCTEHGDTVTLGCTNLHNIRSEHIISRIRDECEYFRLKDDIEEKEEKLQEKFERALRRERKPKSVEQLLRKPRKSVLERVNKKRAQMERKAQKRAIKSARRKRIKAAFENHQW